MRFALIVAVVAGPSVASHAAASYRWRYSRFADAGCDYRFGWVVAPVGDVLFAGGFWDQEDCGRAGYGLLAYDLATGVFRQSLLGTIGATSAGNRVLLDHVDGIEVVDPSTFAVEKTIVGPNAAHPWLSLRGTVQGDLLAVGEGDTPDTQGRWIVFRLSLDSGTVVQRYVPPPTTDFVMTMEAVAAGDLVAVGAYTDGPSGFDGSESGVFVFGADDGVIRWSTPTPPARHFSRTGPAMAWSGNRLVVGVPSSDATHPHGKTLVFAKDTGELLRTLEAPVSAEHVDFFGAAVAATDRLVVIGARGIGGAPTPGRAFVYDPADWSLVDTLSAYAEIPMGDAVAIAGDLIVVGGNENDGVVHVFEPDDGTPGHCPASCDDRDPCTADACVDGACVVTPIAGFEGARCRIAAVRSQLTCASGRSGRRLAARMDRLQKLAQVPADATPERAARMIRRFMARYRAYCGAVARARLVPACAAAVSVDCDVVD